MSIEKIQVAEFKKFFNDKSKKFCFIIGAGASIEAGMPSGNDFAKLLLYEFLKEKNLLGNDLTITIDKLNTFLKEKINLNNLGSSYNAIYSLERSKEHFHQIFQKCQVLFDDFEKLFHIHLLLGKLYQYHCKQRLLMHRY